MLRDQFRVVAVVILAGIVDFFLRQYLAGFPDLLPLAFFVAVATASFYGDALSSITALIFSAAALIHFLSPRDQLFSFSAATFLRTGLFLVAGSMVCVLMQRAKNAKRLRSREDFIASAPADPEIAEPNRSDDVRFRLAAIVDSSDDAIISKDLNGIVTSWNAAAERLFGYKSEEMTGRSILAIIPPELQNEEPLILANLRAGRKIDHHETTRVRKDGTRIEVSLTISPVKNLSGKIIGASKIARDISERKRVQEALLQSEKIAETARMAAAIAHEVNNPLEAVTNLAYLVSTDETLSPVGRSYAKMLLEEVARASEITKQTLAFYRDSGKPSEFDIRDLLDSVLALNRPVLERKRIKLAIDYRSSETLVGHASEIRQVLANLVLNAIDAVPEGGKITARVQARNSL